MNHRSEHLVYIPILAFILGGAIPSLLFGSFLPHTEWSYKTESLVFFSLFIIVERPFYLIGLKNEKLKMWATDTLIGASLMVFSYSFILFLSAYLFLLLPFSSLTLFALSILLCMAAVFLFFKRMLDDEINQ